jgi:hypothetical protein
MFLDYKNIESNLINREIFLKKSFVSEVNIEENKELSIEGINEKFKFKSCSFLNND